MYILERYYNRIKITLITLYQGLFNLLVKLARDAGDQWVTFYTKTWSDTIRHVSVSNVDYVVAGPNINPRALPYYSIEVISQIIIDMKSQYISYDEYISYKNKAIRLLTKPKAIAKIKTRNARLNIFNSAIYKRRADKL